MALAGCLAVILAVYWGLPNLQQTNPLTFSSGACAACPEPGPNAYFTAGYRQVPYTLLLAGSTLLGSQGALQWRTRRPRAV